MVPFIYIISCSLPLMGIEFSMAGALRGARRYQIPYDGHHIQHCAESSTGAICDWFRWVQM